MGTGKSPYYDLITTGTQLEHLLSALQDQCFIGVDMEADSMYHFKEKVCLIQMAAENLNVIIDPLQIPDLSALRPLFNNCKIQKVFHGADYDIRSLYRDFKIDVNGLFDTQLACRFLGMAETSLEAVIKRWFHVNLKKKYRRKDWSKRPLPDEMIAYAAEDARYGRVPARRALCFSILRGPANSIPAAWRFWRPCLSFAKIRPPKKTDPCSK
jgi:ribonuclease D